MQTLCGIANTPSPMNDGRICSWRCSTYRQRFVCYNNNNNNNESRNNSNNIDKNDYNNNDDYYYDDEDDNEEQQQQVIKRICIPDEAINFPNKIQFSKSV